MSYVLGLTGSIGMGKTTTAAMFAKMGVPVWDADAAVHRLYAQGGAAVAPLAALFPQAIQDGAVARDVLRQMITEKPAVLDQVQLIVHPLIAQDRMTFIESATAPIILLDMPLLYEIGGEALCDSVVVVTCPPAMQRERVLARGQMTAEQLDMILERQIPDAEKRARADWVIDTQSMGQALLQVQKILALIKARRHA